MTPSTHISGITWWLSSMLAIVIGACTHFTVTVNAYEEALATIVQTRPGFATYWEMPNEDDKAGDTADASSAGYAADLLLRYLNVDKESLDTKLTADIIAAFPRPDTHALEAAARIIRPGVSLDDDEVIKDTTAALARLLIGWPAKDDGTALVQVQLVRACRKPSDPETSAPPTSAEKLINCDTWQPKPMDTTDLRGVWWRRSEALPPAGLAQKIFGAEHCLSTNTSATERSAVECQIVAALFRGALDAREVREARRHVNFVWGIERAVVTSLAVLLSLILANLCIQRRPLEKESRNIHQWLNHIDESFSPQRAAHNVYKNIKDAVDHLSNSYAEAHVKKSDRSKPPRVLGELIDAMQESIASPHREHVEKFVELHVQAIIRQRSFINGLITVFPAIGLVATLNGLIHALSLASGIIAGSAEERFIATEQVTSILSSSFATTMMALIFMALFMLWNLRGEHREIDLLENVHRKLISVFWPGRRGAAAAPPPSTVMPPLKPVTWWRRIIGTRARDARGEAS